MAGTAHRQGEHLGEHADEGEICLRLDPRPLGDVPTGDPMPRAQAGLKGLGVMVSWAVAVQKGADYGSLHYLTAMPNVRKVVNQGSFIHNAPDREVVYNVAADGAPSSAGRSSSQAP